MCFSVKNCRKLYDKNEKGCDIIKLLIYRKAPGINCHGAFLVFGKVVLQDGKDDSQTAKVL